MDKYRDDEPGGLPKESENSRRNRTALGAIESADHYFTLSANYLA